MSSRLRLSLLILAVLTISVGGQVRPASALTAAQYASPRISVLVDETHAKYLGGYFYPNTAYMRSVLSSQGYSFDRTQALDSTVLASYDVLVTDLYKENHTRPEIKAIKDWVNDGGRLILTGEWSDLWVPWANNVSSAFDVWFKNGTIYDDAANFNGTSYWIQVRDFAPHPLTRGVDKVVLGAAGIIDMNRSRGIAAVAWSSADSYVNATWVGYKKRGPWPVVGCKSYGNGRVSMISDVSLWAESRLINSTLWQIQLFRNMAEPWSYEIAPKVVDSRGTPLNDARVETRCPNATTLCMKTNSTGHLALKGLSNGSYTLTVIWRGVEVNQTTVTVGILQGDANPEIKARVYYLTVTVTSGIFGGRVPEAKVTVYSTNRTQLESGITGTSGSIEFKQIPYGNWIIEVSAQYLSTSTTVMVDSDESVETGVTLASEVLIITLPIVVVIVGGWIYLLLRAKKLQGAPEHEKLNSGSQGLRRKICPYTV